MAYIHFNMSGKQHATQHDERKNIMHRSRQVNRVFWWIDGRASSHDSFRRDGEVEDGHFRCPL